jgi:hypothetical protein
MIPRYASVLICDEILFSLTGKTNLLGAYVTDIAIPANPTLVNQLIFYFTIETDIQDLFTSLTLHVTLPGSAPVIQSIPVIQIGPAEPSRQRWTMRWPLMLPQVLLRPGRIEAKVIHEKGELIAGTPWIVLAAQQQQAAPH